MTVLFVPGFNKASGNFRAFQVLEPRGSRLKVSHGGDSLPMQEKALYKSLTGTAVADQDREPEF